MQPQREFTVFVDDAYLLSVFVPLHVSHDALVAVVDHLLAPRVAFVQHPHDDQTILVA